jgi:hypothetical protein
VLQLSFSGGKSGSMQHKENILFKFLTYAALIPWPDVAFLFLPFPSTQH